MANNCSDNHRQASITWWKTSNRNEALAILEAVSPEWADQLRVAAGGHFLRCGKTAENGVLVLATPDLNAVLREIELNAAINP